MHPKKNINKISEKVGIKKAYTMYLTKEAKTKIVKEIIGSEKNTGAPEAQIAIFTYRINNLTEHLKNKKKDFVTQRALTTLVGKRKALLTYLKNNNLEKYRELIKTLDLRK